ncbi:MAG TPA: tail fiber protein [Candidatus Omnitrophota bacterium]|nr:tail fiber protein [Candidatus Omnitrophota bacterium]
MDPFTGEIRMMANTYAPMDWANCDGTTLYIQQQAMLFAVIGNRYGGDGVNNFKLPNLQGRTPIGMGQGPGLPNYAVGATGGFETVAINSGQMPAHNHNVNVFSSPGDKAPGNTTLLARGFVSTVPPTNRYRKFYDTAMAGPQMLDNRTIGAACGNQVGGANVHENRQPYLVLNYYICMYGEFPVKAQ